MRLTRITDFQAGTIARSADVDAEFNQILDLLNGKIEDDNILDKGISTSKLKDLKYHGSVPTVSALSTIPNPQHMDLATTDDTLELFGYDATSQTWKKLGGAVASVSHNTLTGRNSPDAHSIDAITGLRSELNSHQNAINDLMNADNNHSNKLANHKRRLDAAEADISLHTAQIDALRKKVKGFNVFEYVQEGENISADFSTVLQRAIDTLHSIFVGTGEAKIVVPEGVYRLKSPVYLRSNIHLDLTKAVIQRDADINTMFTLGREKGVSTDNGNYDRAKNVSILNGIIDINQTQYPSPCSPIAFGHASYILIEGTTFKGNANAYHYIELNAVKYGTVRNCRFTEYTTGSMASEALQLDLMTGEAGFLWYGPYNGNPCQHILIEGNEFINVHDGIGNHASLPGKLHSNIVIRNNRFEGLTGTAIKMLKFHRSVISGNVIYNSAMGIILNTADGDAISNISIIDNLITNIDENGTTGRAIWVFGSPSDNYLISRVVIKGNTIRFIGRHGIGADYTQNTIVAENNVSNVGGCGVWIYATSYAQMINNNVRACGTKTEVGDYVEMHVGIKDGNATLTSQNIVANNMVPRLRVYASQYTLITNNFIYNTGGYATMGTGVSSTNKFVNNYVGTTWTP